MNKFKLIAFSLSIFIGLMTYGCGGGGGSSATAPTALDTGTTSKIDTAYTALETAERAAFTTILTNADDTYVQGALTAMSDAAADGFNSADIQTAYTDSLSRAVNDALYESLADALAALRANNPTVFDAYAVLIAGMDDTELAAIVDVINSAEDLGYETFDSLIETEIADIVANVPAASDDADNDGIADSQDTTDDTTSGTTDDTTSGTTDDSTTDVAVYYPENLTVTSPLEAEASGVSSRSGGLGSYTSQLATITEMLSGGTLEACSFDPALFLETPVNANCYGPAVAYQNHPDGVGGSGQLPGGDLGIWFETEDSTTEACSAAQMNSRMEGVGNKSYAAFTALASMICVDLVSGYGIPSETTNDITTEMNAMATAASLDATFTTATITHATVDTQNEFTYTLEYSFTDVSSTVYPMLMIVTHRSGSTGDYTGRFQYKFNIDGNGGNCPTAASVTPQTVAGSVLYSRTGENFAIDARYANFCGNDATGFVDGVVDPSDKYDAGSNADGWGDNFNRFVASFVESTYLGDYSYSWQAGVNDNNTRALNISVSEDSTTGVKNGEAWFGFGADASTSDNSIEGFLCNWAGPGNSHTYTSNVQYQSLLQDATTGIFEPVTSNLTYAPTVSCNDTSDTFVYDTDADGSLADESATTNTTNNLKTFAEYLSAFTAPTPPSNF